MKVAELKTVLGNISSLTFLMPNGEVIPAHFHLTEIGSVSKNFIDCGGKLRLEKLASLQLWYSSDLGHRLTPDKLLKIIALAEDTLGLGDVEVEVEYQTETVGKYGLAFNGKAFVLEPKYTACLAGDSCGVSNEKTKIKLSDLNREPACCAPGGGCC